MATPLNDLAQRCHKNSVAHGFYEDAVIKVPGHPGLEVRNPSFDGERRDLMHSEIAEMTEASRDGDDKRESEELADLIIRAFGYGAYKGWDLDQLVEEKMAYNETRPYKHGRQR